ncbi:hypothetical protein [Terracidiphilus gabretensis]|uniref:hypothetical protein n=1 Tax=Terracidiphilus gabretensis TaxID=1577687 RepID=UPI00071B615B|nr:hypothetical protein [Terracidiphilus gabretensis]
MAATENPISTPAIDDALTVCAISLLSTIVSDVLHEALGHAAVALVTGAQSGVLSTVAWSSVFDSRLVAAGGTLVNIAAGLILWLALRIATDASAPWRFFLFTSLAFNLFTGTGYFFFSGVTDFGDWSTVIAGMSPHWLWRGLLIVVGIATYYAAVRIIGSALVRYVGVQQNDLSRMRRLTLLPYLSSVFLLCAAGFMNPIGIQLVWQSALPAAAGAQCGLLWMRYYIPKSIVPERGSQIIRRSYTWIAVAVFLSLVFIFVLGRGIQLHR